MPLGHAPGPPGGVSEVPACPRPPGWGGRCRPVGATRRRRAGGPMSPAMAHGEMAAIIDRTSSHLGRIGARPRSRPGRPRWRRSRRGQRPPPPLGEQAARPAPAGQGRPLGRPRRPRMTGPAAVASSTRPADVPGQRLGGARSGHAGPPCRPSSGRRRWRRSTLERLLEDRDEVVGQRVRTSSRPSPADRLAVTALVDGDRPGGRSARSRELVEPRPPSPG